MPIDKFKYLRQSINELKAENILDNRTFDTVLSLMRNLDNVEKEINEIKEGK